MRHCSGVIYHGEWREGSPTLLPSKLVIINPTGKEPLELVQGQPFSIKVQCVNENGEIVEGMILLFDSLGLYSTVTAILSKVIRWSLSKVKQHLMTLCHIL